MNDSAVVLNNVHLSYSVGASVFSRRKLEVLKGLNLQIARREVIGITGRNGAGKSSLLALIAGVLTPDEGSVQNFCQKTALLSLDLGVAPKLTGRMNIMLHALYLGYRLPQVRAQLDNIIAFSGLGSRIDDPLQSYSSGMRARIGFSVIYHMECDCLLIDETLAVGDREFREKSKTALREKIRSGVTAVVVSHDEDTLLQLSDRIVRLDGGRIVQDERTSVIRGTT